MQLTRRGFLGTAGAAAAAAATPHVRAACFLKASRFEEAVAALPGLQKLGYTGYSLNLRLLNQQMNRQAEAHAELTASGLMLTSAHAHLPEGTEEISRLAMAARQFNARSLVLTAATPPDIKTLNDVGKICAEAGTVLAYRGTAQQLTPLLEGSNARVVYFALDIAGAGGLDFFRENAGRVYLVHGSFGAGGDSQVTHELSTAARHVKWISWVVEESDAEGGRAAIKKSFGV